MLTTLLSECDIHLFYTLRCYMPVLMPPATRDALCSLFLQCRREDTMQESGVFLTQILRSGRGSGDRSVSPAQIVPAGCNE